jgi:lipoprotein-anchoring transpeptidase ErfK/SrfK
MDTSSRRPGTGRGPAGAAWVGLVVLALTTASACSTAAANPPGAGPAGRGGAKAQAPRAAATLAFSRDSSGAVKPDRPIRIGVRNGTLVSVTVTGEDGSAVTGELASSGAWTPARTLDVSSTYTVATAVRDNAGAVTTQRTTFTTLTPRKRISASISPDTGDVVGVGMPISVTFADPVKNKAEVERQLVVSATPAVAGAWHWFGSQRVDYRPQRYWKPGTTVTLHAELAGVNAGGNRWGTKDYTHTFTIGSDVRAVVHVGTHRMVVTRNGKLLRNLATGTGQHGFDTWGGIMPVIDKEPVVRMDSCSVSISCTPGGTGFYDMLVYLDVRLTPSGTFVHSAPWDSHIGEANISHGCIHLSPSNARWFYGLVKPGDVVQVVGAPERVASDNGWGGWNLTWRQWLAGSTAPSVPAKRSQATNPYRPT